ncbi:hypothetical protein AGLY_017076 [Aphis glycines]|uniref:Uncharacterized protein n=1 Tax=Aphis glycines TaxID=307491 RepID=A0A6G0SW29_APHGL|nr:hypothetical protein AGLY_017076 [Aphis glycines]
MYTLDALVTVEHSYSVATDGSLLRREHEVRLYDLYGRIAITCQEHILNRIKTKIITMRVNCKLETFKDILLLFITMHILNVKLKLEIRYISSLHCFFFVYDFTALNKDCHYLMTVFMHYRIRITGFMHGKRHKEVLSFVQFCNSILIVFNEWGLRNYLRRDISIRILPVVISTSFIVPIVSSCTDTPKLFPPSIFALASSINCLRLGLTISITSTIFLLDGMSVCPEMESELKSNNCLNI